MSGARAREFFIFFEGGLVFVVLTKERQLFFSLLFVLCIFTQGFSLNMQLGRAKHDFWPQFIRVFEFKVLNTFILDPFAREYTIKHMFCGSPLKFLSIDNYNRHLPVSYTHLTLPTKRIV